VDVGQVGFDGPRDCCVASVGLDEIVLDVVHHSGLPRGKALNLLAALWPLITYRPRPLRIRWQGGQLEDEVMFVAVTNTRGYGGGFLVSPGAHVNDGRWICASSGGSAGWRCSPASDASCAAPTPACPRWCWRRAPSSPSRTPASPARRWRRAARHRHAARAALSAGRAGGAGPPSIESLLRRG
jgi:hypothetical protein